MDKIFFMQTGVSFALGGSFIAFLSLIAERSPAKYAGLILSIPSTVAISFFFHGWLFSPVTVTEISPSATVSLGGMLVMIVVYVYAAQLRVSLGTSIAVAILSSMSVWFVLATFAAGLNITSFLQAFLYFALLAFASHLALNTKRGGEVKAPEIHYNFGQKIVRAIFAGSIVAGSLILSKVFGPRWGGVLSVFPATFLSTLIIYHWYHGPDFLMSVGRATPAGSLILVSFVVASGHTFQWFGATGGTVAAFATSMVVFFILVSRVEGKYSWPL